MLSKVPADIDNQVGIVIVDSRGALGLKMFDHTDSWRAFSLSILRDYADVLAKELGRKGLLALRSKRILETISARACILD